MQEAQYYKKLADGSVRCDLCPIFCHLKEGEMGNCGVRKNIDGTLYALSYRKATSIAVDSIEKKPLYHFYPGVQTLSAGSIGCNLHCLHCQNSSISQVEVDNVGCHLENHSPDELVRMALEHDCSVLVWTYNEPGIWFEYVKESGQIAHEHDLKTAMVTNGVINPEPLKELLEVVDGYRVDLKGFSKEFYKELTGQDVFDTVLESILIAKTVGRHIEIVTNLIPNWNDDEKMLTEMAKWLFDNLGAEVPWHLTAYYPSYQMEEVATSVESLEKAKEIGHKAGLKHVFIGNVPGHPAQDSYCPSCDSLIIQRSGYLLRSREITDGKCNKCGYQLKNYTDFKPDEY